MSTLKAHRTVLVAIASVLTAYGFVILNSTVLPLSQGQSLFIKQCIWLCVAVCAGLFFARINLNKIRTWANWIGGFTLTSLLFVLIPGVSRCVKGSHRWIEIGVLRLQPSEPAKIGFVLFFAYFLSRIQNMRDFKKGFMAPISVIGIFCLAIILEPDFGTAALFGSVGVILLWVRGVKLRFILPTMLIAVGLFGIAVFLNPVRLARILAFLDLENNRLTGAYQLWQSLLAFCSGGWRGCGLGQGRQQFFFLPEAHTDFIGAIVAEELGLVHMFVLLFCFFTIAYLGLKITQSQSQPFLFFVGLGTVSFLIIQVLLNLGIITGLLPTKGLALPFLSYGGSNLVTNFCFIGLLINLTRPIYNPLMSLNTKL